MKILIFKNADPSFIAYAEYLNEMGHDALVVDKFLALTEIKKTVESFRPDFILHNNIDIFAKIHRPDALEVESYFQKCGIPVVVWEYEAPYFQGGMELMMRWKEGRYMKDFLFLSLDSHWVNEFKNAGIACYFLPFGVDDRLKNYQPDSQFQNQFRHDVTYIGTCFTGDTTVRAAPGLEGIFKCFSELWRGDIFQTLFAGTGRDPSLRRSIEILESELWAICFDLMQADIHDVREFQDRMYRDFAKYFDRHSSSFGPDGSPMRLFVECRFIILYSYYQVAIRLRKLFDKGLHIYGEGAWNQVLSDYSRPIRRLSYAEMYAAFRNSKIIYCFTKKLFISNVHERIPHVLGAGGFPLSDHRDDIDVMFEPTEVVTYRSFEEARDLIDFYTRHDDARQNVIRMGRERVFKSHSYSQRMRELIDIVSKHYGLNSKPHRTPVYIQATDWIEKVSHRPKLGPEPTA